MRGLVVGVDAGGSRTVAAAWCDGDVLRVRQGEAGNPSVLGVAVSSEAIASAIASVLEGEVAEAIAVGAAGAGRQETAGELLAALAVRFPAARIAVIDDAQIALRGAIPDGDGVVLIAGTGAIAYAEVGGGRFRAGGYGYALGDDGSGYAIGAAGLRQLVHSYERRVPSDGLAAAIAAHAGASSVRDVLDFVYASGAPITRIASCASVVLNCAAEGERSATKIVQRAALDLFDLLKTVVRVCLADHSTGSGLRSLALSGGLLHENNLLTYLLETRIHNEFPEMQIVKRGEPWRGALTHARALLE
jgi:glucosamine kinase